MLPTEKQVKLACDIYAYCELIKLIIGFFWPKNLTDELFDRYCDVVGEGLDLALSNGDVQKVLKKFSETLPLEEIRNELGVEANSEERLSDLTTRIRRQAQRANSPQEKREDKDNQPTRQRQG